MMYRLQQDEGDLPLKTERNIFMGDRKVESVVLRISDDVGIFGIDGVRMDANDGVEFGGYRD